MSNETQTNSDIRFVNDIARASILTMSMRGMEMVIPSSVPNEPLIFAWESQLGHPTACYKGGKIQAWWLRELLGEWFEQGPPAQLQGPVSVIVPDDTTTLIPTVMYCNVRLGGYRLALSGSSPRTVNSIPKTICIGDGTTGLSVVSMFDYITSTTLVMARWGAPPTTRDQILEADEAMREIVGAAVGAELSDL